MNKKNIDDWTVERMIIVSKNQLLFLYPEPHFVTSGMSWTHHPVGSTRISD